MAALGFIGLGQMGGPMAANLAKGGNSILGFDAAGTQSRLPQGGEAAGSVAKVAAGAETVFLSLPDGKVSESVGLEILSAPGRRVRTVIDTSTIGHVQAGRIAGRLAEAGIAYVDAPVSGGVRGAVGATLAIMVACPKPLFDTLKPTLGLVAKNVFHVGETPGQGQAMKMLNNFLSGIAMAATSEAVSFGLARGLRMDTMLDVLNVSTGQNTATSDKFPRQVATGTFAAGFATRLMAKDVRLYRDGVHETGSAHRLGDLAAEIWSNCEAAMPESDFTEIFKFVQDDR